MLVAYVINDLAQIEFTDKVLVLWGWAAHRLEHFMTKLNLIVQLADPFSLFNFTCTNSGLLDSIQKHFVRVELVLSILTL